MNGVKFAIIALCAYVIALLAVEENLSNGEAAAESPSRERTRQYYGFQDEDEALEIYLPKILKRSEMSSNMDLIMAAYTTQEIVILDGESGEESTEQEKMFVESRNLKNLQKYRNSIAKDRFIESFNVQDLREYNPLESTLSKRRSMSCGDLNYWRYRFIAEETEQQESAILASEEAKKSTAIESNAEDELEDSMKYSEVHNNSTFFSDA